MEKLILIGGQAGQGSDRTSLLLAESLVSLGYFVFNYRDYGSLIKGGHNFNVLKISDQPVFSHEDAYDFIMALDQKTIDLHQNALRPNGFILGPKHLKGKNLLAVDVAAVLGKLNVPPVFGNNILLGALFKSLNLPLSPLFKIFERDFKEKANLIKQTAQKGYDLVETKEKFFSPSVQKGKYFLNGSQAVASGAIAAGLDAFFAYPMTPATPVLNILAAKKEVAQIAVYLLPDEIAVINSALGASFAGAMSMVGTSGGGFALMSEAISMAGMAEIPLVVYLAQRPAPATGVPTYTAQGDLKFALNAGHGEFPKVVLAPGDPQEALSRTAEAFYLAYKYQIPVILLSDKHLAESGYTFTKLGELTVVPQRGILLNPKMDYRRYLLTKNGLSPRTIPGLGPIVRAVSYEHDETGFSAEDGEMIKKMNDKRWRKMKLIKAEVNALAPISVYGKGNNLLIGWGSTKGAILDGMIQLEDCRFLQVNYLSPFPADEVKAEIEKAKEMILIENNVTGLLGQVIREQTGQLIKNKLLKYDGRPFTAQEIIQGVKKFI